MNEYSILGDNIMSVIPMNAFCIRSMQNKMKQDEKDKVVPSMNRNETPSSVTDASTSSQPTWSCDVNCFNVMAVNFSIKPNSSGSLFLFKSAY